MEQLPADISNVVRERRRASRRGGSGSGSRIWDPTVATSSQEFRATAALPRRGLAECPIHVTGASLQTSLLNLWAESSQVETGLRSDPLRGTGLSSWVPVLAELLSRVSCRISGPTSYLAEILGRVQVCVRLSVALPGDCPRLA